MRNFILPSVLVLGLLCLSFTQTPKDSETWISTENVQGLNGIERISIQDFNDIMDNTYIGKKTTDKFHRKAFKDAIEEDVTKHTDPAEPKPSDLIDNIIAKYE